MATTNISEYKEGFFRRVSWGAIFAGVVVVLVTHLMLGLLGIAFGANSISPLEEQNPLAGLGVGSAIWLGATTIIALFAGGWVASRLAAIPDRTESMLHGVVTWGLASLATVYMVSFAAAGILSSTAGIVGKVATMVGQSAQAVAPQIAQAVGEQTGLSDTTWNEVKQEANRLLTQTGNPALQPKRLQKQANQTTQDAENVMGNAAQNPQEAEERLANLWKRIETRGDRILQSVDKEDLANVLVARSNMSKEEAMATVTRWETSLAQAKAQLAEVQEQATQKARQAGDAAADVVAKTAIWSFVGMLVGLLAAAGGGYLGTPPAARPLMFRRRRSLEDAAA